MKGSFQLIILVMLTIFIGFFGMIWTGKTEEKFKEQLELSNFRVGDEYISLNFRLLDNFGKILSSKTLIIMKEGQKVEVDGIDLNYNTGAGVIIKTLDSKLFIEQNSIENFEFDFLKENNMGFLIVHFNKPIKLFSLNSREPITEVGFGSMEMEKWIQIKDKFSEEFRFISNLQEK